MENKAKTRLGWVKLSPNNSCEEVVARNNGFDFISLLGIECLCPSKIYKEETIAYKTFCVWEQLDMEWLFTYKFVVFNVISSDIVRVEGGYFWIFESKSFVGRWGQKWKVVMMGCVVTEVP
jgi:hypothetical protein